MERKALSKRTRFEVFKRDGFRCAYCGSTPNDGPLHVDHVVPVAEGGANEPSNLVTACASCNLGKSAVPLGRGVLPAVDPDAVADQAEQIRAWLEAQKAVIEAKERVEQEMVDLWCRTFGVRECNWDVPGRLLKILNEWGMAKLCEALQICSGRRFYKDADRLRYVYGILRNWKAEALDA